MSDLVFNVLWSLSDIYPFILDRGKLQCEDGEFNFLKLRSFARIKLSRFILNLCFPHHWDTYIFFNLQTQDTEISSMMPH